MCKAHHMQPEKAEHFNLYSTNYSERQNQKKQQQKQEKHGQRWPELGAEPHPQKKPETEQDLQGAVLLLRALYQD